MKQKTSNSNWLLNTPAKPRKQQRIDLNLELKKLENNLTSNIENRRLCNQYKNE